jgi:outer membrane usher protein
MSGATSPPSSTVVRPRPGAPKASRGVTFVRLALGVGLSWLATLAPSASAQTPAVNGPLEDVPVALVLNGEPRGDVFAKLTPAGELLLRVSDFTAFRVTILGGKRHRVDGAEYVLATSIPEARSTFDEDSLTLLLHLPPESFDAQRRNLSQRRAAGVVATQEDSAFLNYRLFATGADGADTALGLVNEVGVRREQWLLLSGSQVGTSDTEPTLRRFQTQLVRDDRERARRWIIGDTFTQGSDLGSALILGGVTLAKNYQLRPYFVYSPTATIEGSVAMPSDVEVFVGGTRVFRERLAPGTYSLSDFNYYGGRRDVRVVVRDAFGQEQVLEYPYYFTDRVLGAGLHEYRYHAGFLREDYAQPGDRYTQPALSASHRYGLSDRVTIGGRGEYADGRYNAGPDVALRSDRFGIVSAGVSYGGNPDAGSGVGTAASYQFQSSAVSLRLAWRGFADGYGFADPLLNESHVRSERLVAAGYGTPALGHVNVQWLLRDEEATGEQRVTQVNYSRTLLRRIALFVAVQHDTEADAGTSVSAGLTSWFGAESNVSTFYTHSPDTDSLVAQASNTIHPREGLGYRVSAESVRQESGDSTRLSPYLELNAPRATYIVEAAAQETDGAGTSTSWLVAAQGSIYAVGEDHWGFGRRVDDSFALARVTPPLPDVRVYFSGREVGSTDEHGEILLPGLVSFLDNSVAIEDEDVPIDYTIGQVEQAISPPYRGGSLIEFALGVQRNVVGRLVLQGGAPLEYAAFTLRGPAGEQQSQTGAEGEFYLEDLAAGAHAGTVRIGERECRFTLQVPDRVAPIIEIEQPVVCAY